MSWTDTTRAYLNYFIGYSLEVTEIHVFTNFKYVVLCTCQVHSTQVVLATFCLVLTTAYVDKRASLCPHRRRPCWCRGPLCFIAGGERVYYVPRSFCRLGQLAGRTATLIFLAAEGVRLYMWSSVISRWTAGPRSPTRKKQASLPRVPIAVAFRPVSELVVVYLTYKYICNDVDTPHTDRYACTTYP